MFTKESIVQNLRRVRDPIAKYQEPKGISSYEQYSFTNLITSLCQEAYNAAVTIFTMLYNLLPLLESFICLLRFVLDKTIDILESTTTSEKIIKSLIFLAELLALLFLLYFIMSLLLLPILHFTSIIIHKIFKASSNPR